MKPLSSLPSLLSQPRAALLAAPREVLMAGAPEVARMLGICEATVWRLHAMERIPAPMRLGRRTLWNVEELRDWLRCGMPPRDKWIWGKRGVS